PPGPRHDGGHGHAHRSRDLHAALGDEDDAAAQSNGGDRRVLLCPVGRGDLPAEDARARRRRRAVMLFPTTLVGSYPQPEWLIGPKKLAGRFPPRVRARELWRIAPELLGEAQNDATILAIKAQEDAGLDII